MKSMIRRAAAAAALVALAACGGGGGAGEPPPPPDPAPFSGTVGAAVVSGKVTYDYVPNIGGKLDYSRTQPRPVRGATVEIIDHQNQSVLAATQTDSEGAYLTPVVSGRQVRVRVRAELKSERAHVTVRDNTQGGARYVMETKPFVSETGQRSLHASSGWTGTDYTAPRVAGPFAILDTVYASQSKVLALDAKIVLPELALNWSPSNKPAQGDVSLGDITVSHFRDYEQPASIYVLGQADVDTDEYDESVVAHEWGHFYQSVFSRDDTLGGSHDGEPLEMSVAFSEGWSNGWQAIALGRTDYADSYGAGQASASIVLPLTSGDPDRPGWYSERSVAYIIWKLAQAVGFAPIHQAMVNLRHTPAFTSIHAFAHSLRQHNTAAADRLDALLTSQNIVTSAASGDPFGTGEVNDAGLGALAAPDPSLFGMPVYLPLTAQAADASPIRWTNLCSVNLFGSGNKLGIHRAGRIDVSQSGTYRFYTAAAEAGSPYLTILVAGERLTSRFTGSVGFVDLQMPSGVTVFTLTDERVRNGSSRWACLTVAVFRIN